MRFLVESVKILYGVNEKCIAKCTEGDSTPQYKKKMSCENRPSEAYFRRFLSYDLLETKENAQRVNLEHLCRVLYV